MTELKSCPFCGGEAETFNPFENIDGTWCVLCSDCACSTGFEQTEAEAVEAWNTRAERTCKAVRNERMTPHTRICSECGSVLTKTGSYCPSCGARVVNND